MYLLHCTMQLAQNTLGITLAQLDQINHIANEQPNIIQRVV